MHSPLRKGILTARLPPKAPLQPQSLGKPLPKHSGHSTHSLPSTPSLQQADTFQLPGPHPRRGLRSSSRKLGLPARLCLPGSGLWSPSGTSLYAQTWSSVSTQPQDLKVGTQPRERKPAAAAQAPAPAFPRVSWETSFKQQQTAKLIPAVLGIISSSLGLSGLTAIFLLLTWRREEELNPQGVGLVSHWMY